MRGLALVLFTVLFTSVAAIAGPLEMWVGGGPAATSLEEVNAAIGVFNTLISHLNDTFAVHPDVSGAVKPLRPIISGLALRAGERYWLSDWFAIGGQIEYVRSASATAGEYVGSSLSTIDIALGFHAVDLVLNGRATFLDVGLRLAAEVGAGFYYSMIDRAVIFEVPSEYPDAISGIPSEGSDRFSGSTLGFEAGISLAYPLTEWFTIGSLLTYRSATVPSLSDDQGAALDIDGNGVSDSISLDGITVQLTFSITVDLSPQGEKE